MLSLIFIQNFINSLVITIVHTKTFKLRVQNKLSVSFPHDLNKHNVYSGIKLTIRKSMLLMRKSMLILNATTPVLLMDSDVRPVYAVLLSCKYSMICDNCRNSALLKLSWAVGNNLLRWKINWTFCYSICWIIIFKCK